MNSDISSAPATLYTVQLLRGIAATLVVLFHSAAIWREIPDAAGGYSGLWDQGYAGVDLFFVISGFIMVYIAGKQAAGIRPALRFLAARALRVYPLWWAACALMGLYFLLAYGVPAAPESGGGRPAWTHFALSMSLWPVGTLPVLQVGWTLTFELGFYALFGLLILAVPPRWRLPAIGVWAVIIGVFSYLADGQFQAVPNGWAAWLVHPLCLEFVLGAFVAGYIIKLRSRLMGLILLGAGLAALVIALMIDHAVLSSSFPLYRVAVFGIPSAALLGGIVILEREGRLSIPAPLKRLGDASYSLYLFHFLILLALRRAFEFAGYVPPFWAFLLLGTIVSIAGSMIAWRLIERPLHRASRKRLSRVRK